MSKKREIKREVGQNLIFFYNKEVPFKFWSEVLAGSYVLNQIAYL